MSSSDSDNPTTQTFQYLLAVVENNCKQRCAEVRESARSQVSETIRQVHTRVRGRMHRHVQRLRDKYRDRVSVAQARNQTLLRQHRQLADRECLDTAWPLLQEALRQLWDDPVTRRHWLDKAVHSASSRLLKRQWRVEYPLDFSDEEQRRLQHSCTIMGNCTVELTACDDIAAGIRIITDGTVIDATLDGLLRHRTVIEAMLISRIKKDISSHD